MRRAETKMRRVLVLGMLALFLPTSVSAAQDVYIYSGAVIGEDLTFPTATPTIGYARATRMPKLAGRARFQPS